MKFTSRRNNEGGARATKTLKKAISGDLRHEETSKQVCAQSALLFEERPIRGRPRHDLGVTGPTENTITPSGTELGLP